MTQLLSRLLGGITPLDFGVYYFWALVGAFITMQIHAQTRDVKSFRSPVRFSWAFWLQDNSRRILFNLVLIGAFIRFSDELIHVKISDVIAFGIGLAFDLLSLAITKLSPVKLSGFLNKQEGAQ